jgi:hypothetical protein
MEDFIVYSQDSKSTLSIPQAVCPQLWREGGGGKGVGEGVGGGGWGVN